jgi:hypothetical protein
MPVRRRVVEEEEEEEEEVPVSKEEWEGEEGEGGMPVVGVVGGTVLGVRVRVPSGMFKT